MPKYQPDNSRFQIDGEKPVLTSNSEDRLPTPKSKKPLGIALGAVTTLTLLGAVLIVPNLGGEQADRPTIDTPVEAQPQAVKGLKWYEQEDIETAVEVPEWAQEDVLLEPEFMESNEFTEEATDSFEDTDAFKQIGTSYPPASITTSDPEEAFDQYGVLNPAYSFITDEIFVNTLYGISQQFLNPMAGGWSSFQYPQADAKRTFSAGSLGEVLTPEYSKKVENASDKSFFPVMADWNKNNYGVDNLVPQGPRWIGRVTDSSLRLDWNEKLLNYDAYVTMNVTYTSWTVDKTKVSKEGVLKLKLVANKFAFDNSKFLRLLVADGSLELK